MAVTTVLLCESCRHERPTVLLVIQGVAFSVCTLCAALGEDREGCKP